VGARLSQTPGLTFGLEQAQDVVLADCLRVSFSALQFWRGVQRIPGPLTLRMMERVWSSMNSTRHWVTPPREPRNICQPAVLPMHPSVSSICPIPALHMAPQKCVEIRVPVRPRTRVTLTSLTGALAVSIMCDCVFDGNRSFVWSWTSGWRSLRSVRRAELLVAHSSKFSVLSEK
jgi:hypothetical protein